MFRKFIIMVLCCGIGIARALGTANIAWHSALFASVNFKALACLRRRSYLESTDEHFRSFSPFYFLSLNFEA